MRPNRQEPWAKALQVALSIAISFIALTPQKVSAQLDGKTIEQTITSAMAVLQQKYVFPSLADSAAGSILTRLRKGQYQGIATGGELAFQLTRELQLLTGDQHLKVTYSERVPNSTETGDRKDQSRENWTEALLKENNYGISDKKILQGNIGYLNIPLFGPLEKCADTLISAMAYVSGTDALIIDLRSCRGSLDENTIPFLHSYFFEESVHLSDFFTRESGHTKQFWSAAWLPGKRYIGKPIYLLTSGRTFSGGEAFCYDLQQHKRAKVIGEVTRGGANPTQLERLNDQFNIAVPYARSINPLTGTNWEGSGVRPDSLVRSNLALYLARLIALEEIRKGADKADDEAKLQEFISQLRKNPPSFRTITFVLQGYGNASEVAVSGSFNYYSRNSLKLKKNAREPGRGPQKSNQASYCIASLSTAGSCWIQK